jgi:hypothetical protein
MITISNNFEDNVYIRISNESGSDTEEQEIAPGSSYSWERAAGDYCVGVRLRNPSYPEAIATISSPCEAYIDSTSLLNSDGMTHAYGGGSFKSTRFDPLLKSNEKSCVEIRNNYPSGIYVRISGDDQGEGLKYIASGDDGIFYRLGGRKYDCQVVFNVADPNLNSESQIYSVFPPNVYQFKESQESGMEGVIEFYDAQGSHVSSGWRYYKP